jgi:LmbE family N-acetylglucosaminyl deacetylase
VIVPLVSETVWSAELTDLRIWNPPNQPVLIIAPHPDDETLGIGGLIAAQERRGVDVVVAAVTDGENAYPNTPGLARLRQDEQISALTRLGVRNQNIIRFGLPDGGVASREQELMERLAPLICGDTHVMAPWHGDFHPDHEACGRAAEKLVRRIGATLTFYFFWTWHFGSLASVGYLPLRNFSLDEELLRAKADALSCYRSQLEREHGEPILPEMLLAPARRHFETFAIA